MAIQTLIDDGTNIPSKYDGAAYAVALPDCVCGNVGDEFAINYSASSLQVTFEAGSQAVVGGQFFHVTQAESLQLPSNSDGYICAEIDNSQSVGATGSFRFLTSAAIKRDNINGNGTIHDVILYRVITGANGVNSVVDMRPILGTPHAQVYMSKAEFDSLPIRLANVDYNVFED